MPISSPQLHDRLRAAHRQQRGDGVGVVAAHHAERAAGVAGCRACRARAGRRAPRRGGRGCTRSTFRRARRRSRRRLRARSWSGSIARSPLLTVLHPPSGRPGGHGAESTGRRVVRPQQNRRARAHVRVVAVPRRPLGRAAGARPRRSTRRVGRGDRALRAGHRDRAARHDAAPAGRARRTRSTSLEIPIDDSWVRDNGPIFVVDGHGGVAAVRLRVQRLGRQVRARSPTTRGCRRGSRRRSRCGSTRRRWSPRAAG